MLYLSCSGREVKKVSKKRVEKTKKLKNKKELEIHKLLTLKNILTITTITVNLIIIYKFFKGL